MDEDVVRAYLWEDIIRLGFSPAGTKKQKNWLFQYGKSLREFWEVSSFPDPPTVSNSFLVATIDSSCATSMSYEYAIENHKKYTVRLIHTPASTDRDIMWMHDMDGTYFSFPNQFFLSNLNHRRTAVQEMNSAIIGNVLDSLIMHPAPHQHIESPLDNHDIRIGGGLLNPFLYLFHLRIQLCPNSDRRSAERDRLILLFEAAIKGNAIIPPGELMRVPSAI